MLFVTPTFPDDYGRVGLLRSSLERFNPDDHHALIVRDADAASARSAFGADATILTHREVLPAGARTLWALPGPARKALKVGWWLQQVAKLHIGRTIGASSWVCLDSDTFLLDHLPESECYAPDGRLWLLELIDHPVDDHIARFNAATARLLGSPPEAATVHLTYTGQCVPISGVVCDELFAWLEDRYRGPWWLTMIRRRATEYALHGQFARYHHHLREVVPRHEYPSVDIYERLGPQEAQARLEAGRSAGKHLAMFHSRLGYEADDLRRLAEQIWSSS